MPTALTDMPLRTDPPRKRWTRVEYENLQAAMADHEKLELIEGELISKMGKKRPHVNALMLLHEWLVQIFGARFVHPEAPIDVAPEDNPSSEPEPDLIVTRLDLGHFLNRNPRPEELLLVVEISDATLGFDLTSKARLYARAKINEYWVLDVARARMIVHRDPLDGSYRDVAIYEEHETVTPLAAPGSQVRAGDVVAGNR